MYQHPSDWHNDTGVIRQAKEQEMGVILMRPLTSGVFQRLMAETFPDIDAVASDGWSGAAAAQLCAFGSVRGRGPGRYARAAICGAEQQDFGRRRVADRRARSAPQRRCTIATCANDTPDYP
jgi:hypothetical protein